MDVCVFQCSMCELSDNTSNIAHVDVDAVARHHSLQTLVFAFLWSVASSFTYTGFDNLGKTSYLSPAEGAQRRPS